MKTTTLIATVLVFFLGMGTALAADAGDRIENRLDRRGDRIDNRLDRKGQRLDRRYDRRHA